GVGQLADGERRVRIEGQDQVAFLAQHQLAGDRARAIRIGLAVLDDDVDTVRLAADLQSVLERRLDSLDRPRRDLAEICATSRLRGPDPEFARWRLRPRHRCRPKRPSHADASHAGRLEEYSPADHGDLLVFGLRRSYARTCSWATKIFRCGELVPSRADGREQLHSPRTTARSTNAAAGRVRIRST